MAEREYRIEVEPKDGEPFIIHNQMFGKEKKHFAKLKFEIQAHHYVDPNNGKFSLWGLPKEYRDHLDVDFDPSRKKHETKLKFYVGHKGRIGMILDGGVFWGKPKKQGVDWITTCEVGQAIDELQSSYVNEIVTEGTPHSSWLRMLIKKVGDLAPNAKDKAEKIFKTFEEKQVNKGLDKEVKKTMTLIGNPAKLAENALKEIGATFYIDQTGINLGWKGETNGEPPIILTSEDIIDAPDKEHFGAKIKTIINPAIRVGSEIDLRTKTLTRLLTVIKMDVTGDTHDPQNWTYDLSCYNKVEVPDFNILDFVIKQYFKNAA